MQKRSLVALVSIVAILVLGVVPMAMAQDVVVKIASQSPLSGGQETAGTALRNGAALAIEQFNAAGTAGFTVELAEFDDEATADVGVANAAEIVADAAILGVVAHINSGVAIPSSEVYDAAGLAMVSPGVTNPAVTDRALATVNRISGRDDSVASVITQYLLDSGSASLYVIDDTTTYGVGLAELVTASAEAAGLTIAGSANTSAAVDFAAVVAAAPDAVLVAGSADPLGTVVSDLVAAGFAGVIIGGDGLDTPDFAELAGDAAVGVHYVTTAAPASTFEAAAQFIEDYTAAYGEAPTPFAVESFDSANIILAAIASATEAAGGTPTREAVAAEIRATADYEGLSGVITFDANGDRTEANYFVLTVTSADPAEWGTNTVDSTIQIASPLAAE